MRDFYSLEVVGRGSKTQHQLSVFCYYLALEGLSFRERFVFADNQEAKKGVCSRSVQDSVQDPFRLFPNIWV